MRVCVCVFMAASLSNSRVLATGSGVAMGWAGWAKSRRPSAGAAEFRANLKKNNFPVTVKIRTSGYRTLEFSLQHSKLVHVGETCYNLQTLGCELHKNAFGGRALHGPTGELLRSPDPLAVIKGKEREIKSLFAKYIT